MAKTVKLSDEPVGTLHNVGDTIVLQPGSGEASSTTSASPVHGTAVAQFVILETLGRGGMGEVFLAYNSQLHRRVALKLLSQRHKDDQKARRDRMLMEARTMAMISHPHVVPIHSVGISEGRVYIAMAYVEGGTLSDWLGKSRGWREIVDLMIPVAEALATAHEAGIVHRDIKPQNILVRSDNHAFLTDFGIAATVENEAEETTRYSVEGTPDYMAPEQALGSAPDPRSDIYSFCATLYSALNGEPLPSEGGGAVSLSGVPAALRNCLCTGLAQDPADRQEGMDTLIRELRVARRARRQRVIAASSAAFIMLAGLLVFKSLDASHSEFCHGNKRLLNEVWDEPQREGIHSAFAATELTDSADVAKRTVASLDLYAREWVSHRTQACKATRVYAEQSKALLDMRMHCYDLRLGELDALLETMEGDAILRAADGLTTLGDLSTCLPGPVMQRAERKILATPEALAVSREIARLRSLHSLGKYEQGVSIAKTLRPRVQALRSPQHLAEFELVLARHYKTLYQAEEAWTGLLAASVSAAEAGDNQLVARIWTQAIFVLGYQLGRNPEADMAALAARAAVEQSRANDAVRSNFLTKLAILRRAQGKWEESEKLQREGMALRIKHYGEEHPLVGKSASNLGNLLTDMSRFEEAAAAQEIAARIARKSYGSGNAALADTLANLVSVLRIVGDMKRAVPLQREVLSIYQRAHGVESRKSLAAQAQLAVLLAFAGNTGEVKTQLEESLAGMHATKVDINRSEWLEDLALALLLTGEGASAEVHSREARRLRLQFQGEDDMQLGSSFQLLARIMASQSECAQALTLLDKADVLWVNRTSSRNVPRAWALRTRAQCSQSPAEIEYAQALLEESRNILSSTGAMGYEFALTIRDRLVLSSQGTGLSPEEIESGKAGLAELERSGTSASPLHREIQELLGAL